MHTCKIIIYPMLRAESRFWLINNREIWSRISRLTSSAWDIKTKERHWWRHNGDSDRRPLSLPLWYDLVTLCLYDDLGQINVIAGILKLRKRFRMSQILFEHGINSLPLSSIRRPFDALSRSRSNFRFRPPSWMTSLPFPEAEIAPAPWWGIKKLSQYWISILVDHHLIWR